MTWDAAESGAFRTRIGDFYVDIGPDTPIIVGQPPITLTVTRIDGVFVERISEMMNPFSDLPCRRVPMTHDDQLRSMYDFISGGGDDFVALLRLLR